MVFNEALNDLTLIHGKPVLNQIVEQSRQLKLRDGEENVHILRCAWPRSKADSKSSNQRILNLCALKYGAKTGHRINQSWRQRARTGAHIA